MSSSGGIRWLAWFIAGPTIWAVSFSAAYGLHGLGCAWDWTSLAIGPVSLQRAAILLVWLAGMLACLALLPPAGRSLGPDARLPRLGLWIGFVATLFTLAPALVASTC
ncbi:hypothetical protein [Ancylobacter sp.]|uniref:hypothetical protein n=1 Tax=Ancylobacter sp. TaxID=1872567 RepID=UPI003D0A438A